MDEITEDRIERAVRHVFAVRRKQFGNFPNYPLVALIATVMDELQKTLTHQWNQQDAEQVREYILDNLTINASLPAQ